MAKSTCGREYFKAKQWAKATLILPNTAPYQLQKSDLCVCACARLLLYWRNCIFNDSTVENEKSKYGGSVKLKNNKSLLYKIYQYLQYTQKI